MEQVKKPVEQWYYSQNEWNRLGCGPLPAERDRSLVVKLPDLNKKDACLLISIQEHK